ncbi:MAG: hypothetical protein M1832_001753 [Thelocarpon impressellum]|nr:MAG: hypothetical protein M1832_001753 [Thelocarpon impressellum]
MQSFSFAQPNVGPRENQKNYVFVDEHNRHKRLKVMRACEGCRRRKIKCDAATTNTWPCSACIRLKLHCVPPTVNYDRELAPGEQGYEPGKGGDFDTSDGSGEEDYNQHLSLQHQLVDERHSSQGHAAHIPYAESVGVYQTTAPYMMASDSNPRSMSIPYTGFHDPSVVVPDTSYHHHDAIFSTPPHQPIHQTAHASKTPESWHSGQYSPTLIETLGELKIDENGVAPYISQQKKNLAGAPPMEEFDDYIRNLPLPPPGPDMTVRIPAEFMPSEEQAMHYFDIFFADVHPYVPVVEKSYFYHQWHTNRDSISTLILEAIFACAGGMSQDPSLGAKWLALAGKHADSFMDVPRLSTIQAMLLILKARESSPKRGYYFRSWMTVVTLVAMAKDLGLDEHYELHQAGQPCDSTYNECIVKTRVWQTLFVVELMVGAPQGRTVMSVDPDTVDLTIPRAGPGLDDAELHISRDWVFMARIIKNVRRMNDIYGRVKKKKDWGSDPQFVQLNPTFTAWLEELPPDLQITYPTDGSSPWVSSHFVGHLHSYYNLSIIMLHRPQLACSDSFAVDGEWKRHMMLCYTSAKNLCRLQEAILTNFGRSGLLCMQRGVGFTVYAVLTCTVLHLVAMTSPDPELNVDAKDFFTRHMRILEQCTRSSPMPEIQAQIDALREAFSADTSKPFVLKATFPYNSPPMGHARTSSLQTSPLQNAHFRSNSSCAPVEGVGGANYSTHPLSPPMSAGLVDPRRDSTAGQSLLSLAAGQHPQTHPGGGVSISDQLTWNPSRIFHQWNTAFGTSPHNATVPGPTAVRLPVNQDLSHEATTAVEQASTTLQDTMQNAFQSIPSHAPAQPLPYSTATITPTFVSPSMWQSSVAAVYEDGLKRRWDVDGGVVSPLAKRQR